MKRTTNKRTPAAPPAFLLLLLVLVWNASACPAQTVITYSAPAPRADFFAKSARYQVKANGKNVFIYDFDPTHTLALPPPSLDPKPAHWEPGVFGSFDFSGKITVTVTASELVTDALIRPRSAGIKCRVQGHTVSFDLSKPCNIGLEINGNKDQPLFLFANPITSKPDKNDPNVIYLAGGKIYDDFQWPEIAGKTLYIEGGAIVRAHERLSKNCTDTRICGTGIITGQNPTKNQGLFGWQPRSKNFQMDGPIFVSTHRGGEWAVVPFAMENAVLHNIKVFGFYRDGLDILSCRHLTVDHCFLWSYDDACVIKASQYADRTVTSGVTVQNSVIWNHGLMIGFETRAPYMENIVFRNNDIVCYRGNTGSPLKPHPYYALNNPIIGILVSDQATVRNIRYEDIRIEYPWTDAFFQFVVDKNYASTSAEKGNIDGVYLKNIRIIDTDTRLTGIYQSLVQGMDAQHRVSHVLIEGLFWEGKELSSAEEAKITVHNHADGILVQPLASRETVPAAPSALRAGSDGGFQIELNWTDHADNEDGFALERRDGNAPYHEIIRLVANLTDWHDLDLKEGTTYHYRVRAYNQAGASAYSNEMAGVAKGQVPFHGTAFAVPGTVEAEDFDVGGEGVSWHDSTGGNSGGDMNSAGRYRSGVDPDIGEEDKNIFVGWLEAGEWLAYTIDVREAGEYTLDVIEASGGSGGKLHLAFGGADTTGPIILPGTGGWANWKGVTRKDIALKAGRQVMRIYIDAPGFNLDKIVLRKQPM